MEKYIISISFVVILAFVAWLLIYTPPQIDYVLYHVVLIPYDVTHKPMLPSKKENEYLIVINQSSFMYVLDASRKQHEFRVANQTLTKSELKEIAKEMLPKEAKPKFYIF
jgi:hypothetical protein